jgi:cytidylate kinase
MNAPVITVDGPGGSGKGMASRALAHRLGWYWLDSGALYRLVALAAHRDGLNAERAADVARAAELARMLPVEFDYSSGEEPVIYLSGENVTRDLRSEACGALASRLASRPAVRKALLQLQRDFRRSPGLVADGRDMGTVVFPQARLKIFLTADVNERARRRKAQLSTMGVDASLDGIRAEIAERDRRDAEREHSPLVPAKNAHILDTTKLYPEAVVEQALKWAREARLFA